MKVIYIEANIHTTHKIYNVYRQNSNNNIYNNTYAQKIYRTNIFQKQHIDGTKCKIWKLKLTRKATSFKSLRVICWENNRVTSKSQKMFWAKLAKKALKQK